jgi:hypothetical protein
VPLGRWSGRSGRAVAARAVAACALGLGAACSHAPAGGLPAGGPGSPAGPVSGRAGDGEVQPPPDDAHAAVPDVDAHRVRSPAYGPVRLTVRTRRPTGEAAGVYDAYLGWVRAYLAAFAWPGAGDDLASVATPAAVRVVREQAGGLVARGWAEYGTAVAVRVGASPAGAAATVVACLDLSGLATRDAQGRLAGRDHPVRSVAHLVVSSGRWLVGSDEKTAVARCA